MGSAPAVTVVVCTADRPAQAATAVAAILASSASPDRSFEVIVVDQTDGPDTATALGHLLSDDRLQYIHADAVGKGGALGLGLARARGQIIACTDDDCVVASDWLALITAPFADRPQVAVVFGRVDAGPHDPQAGFVPAYQPQREGERRSLRGLAPDGMGACMAVRRSAILALGGFDPTIGPGGPFRSGDDRDVAIRALLAGYSLYETAAAAVTHHGFRTFRDGRVHARRAWYGIGAICAKALRRHRTEILPVIWDLFVLRALLPAALDALHLRRPRGGARSLWFVRGLVRGLRTPLRPDALVYDLQSPNRSRTQTP
jgi:GT2 family glycosyltransferase